MKAELVFSDRGQLSETLFYEIIVWRVPAPVPPTRHGFKYRLALIENGARVLGFDNERGKGDHRHKKGEEFRYRFVSVDQLIDDFFDEVEKWNGEP